MKNYFKTTGLLPAAACLVLLSACQNGQGGSSAQKERERLEASGRAAAAITASLSKEYRSAFSGKAPPSINVHVGDITLIGFDEAIDAEEWGMTENNIENTTGKPAAGLPPEKAAMLNKSQDPADNRTLSRRVDLSKAGTVIVLTEQSSPAQVQRQAPQVQNQNKPSKP